MFGYGRRIYSLKSNNSAANLNISFYKSYLSLVKHNYIVYIFCKKSFPPHVLQIANEIVIPEIG